MNLAEINLSKRQAHKSARASIDFILSNLETLRLKDRGGKMEQATLDFYKLLNSGESLTPTQLSYVETIYERVMENLGYGNASPTRNFRKKKLNYG